MEDFISYLQTYELWGNSGLEYGAAFGVFVLSWIVLKVFKHIVLVRLGVWAQKTDTDLDDVVIEAVNGVTSWFYFVVSLVVASQYVSVEGMFERGVRFLVLLVFVYETVRIAEKFIRYGMSTYLSSQKKGKKLDAHDEAMAKLAVGVLRLVVWSVAGLTVLANIGVDVTSLIASLGIGGLAIALALQNILSDLFSSFSLYADKPFEVGDFIVIGTDSGTVKKIGLKTTRLKTLRGEELVVSNKELTSARVQNLKKLTKRRELLQFGVTYQTSEKELQQIPEMVKSIVDKATDVAFDRCHLAQLGPSSLDFECVYYIDSSDYQVYMDKKQEIHLALIALFAQKKIEFAYPTQTVFVEK